MLRITIFFASTALLSSFAAAQGLPLDSQVKTLNTIFSDYWEDYLRHNPEFASTIGDNRFNDQLSDYSVEAYNESLSRDRAFLTRLAEVDTTAMPEQEQLSKDLLVRRLIQNQEEARFKPWELPVNQFYGLQVDLPQLVSQLTFKTVKDYDDYIARLKQVPRAFQQVTDDMSIGMDDHREPPAYLMEKVLSQVNDIASKKPQDGPFAQPVQKFPTSVSAAQQARIKEELFDVIGKQVIPAYVRFGKFLQAQYIPGGRKDPGIWALPDGEAYYRFLVKQSTTTDLTPEQIHQIGVDQVKQDEDQLLAIAHKLGFADIKALETAAAHNPKLFPTSKEQLLDAYRGYLDRMRPKLPQLFGHLPKAQLVVKAVPDYLEKDQAPAYYDHGSPDGSRPGTVYVNTYKFETRSLADVECRAYHEGLPGHHLQISIAQELTGVPQFRKYTYYTAYVEGWGLYAEQLGKDEGFYQDPYSDLGRVEADIWRAIRLVVDTGVHSQHWTRQQMVDYFHQHSDVADIEVQAEVDRYIAWPAQALGYKIGQLKLLELRAKARQALGDKFSLKAFHDQVLDAGALPLDYLEQRIDNWIAQQKTQN
ncbi:MAG TPA: DUF885 domain-containing protein [Acidobacteriaceae bacterium]|nr:DUF885 domain-containing protein [Acidobacteriaceae bacterium]